MHNGVIGGFQSIRRKLVSSLSDEAFQAISGSTDSEHIFALFLDHFRRISRGGNRLDEMAAALTSTIREVEELTDEAGITEPSRLNLAVTDGSSAVASRHISAESGGKANSLYVHAGTSFVCKDGHYRMVKPEKGNAVLVASEPLSGHKAWTKVPPNTMVLVHRDLKAEMRPLEI
jgi:glutamine amidotransferase